MVCATLNCIDLVLISASAITGCVSISAFVSLAGIGIGITSSAVRLKIRTVTAEFKKHNSIIKEKKKKYNKVVLLAK